jgi:hypothetical protein
VDVSDKDKKLPEEDQSLKRCRCIHQVHKLAPRSNTVAAAAESELEQASGERNRNAKEEPQIELFLGDPDRVKDCAEQDDVVHDSHQVHTDPSAAETATSVLTTATGFQAHFETHFN